jgi:hypothetical protein
MNYCILPEKKKSSDDGLRVLDSIRIIPCMITLKVLLLSSYEIATKCIQLFNG